LLGEDRQPIKTCEPEGRRRRRKRKKKGNIFGSILSRMNELVERMNLFIQTRETLERVSFIGKTISSDLTMCSIIIIILPAAAAAAV
jgi:hypothetical protein